VSEKNNGLRERNDEGDGEIKGILVIIGFLIIFIATGLFYVGHSIIIAFGG
jgi:hypothetical protein